MSLSAWILAPKKWSLIGRLLSLPGSRPPTSSHPRSAKRPTSGSRKAVASPVPGKGGKKSGKESSTSRPGSSVSDLVLFLLLSVVGGVIRFFIRWVFVRTFHPYRKLRALCYLFLSQLRKILTIYFKMHLPPCSPKHCLILCLQWNQA